MILMLISVIFTWCYLIHIVKTTRVIVNESENIYDRLSSYEEIYLQFITGDKDMRAHIRHSMPLCIRTSDHSTTRESRNDSPMLYMYVHVTPACKGEFLSWLYI